jgi:hypothetical protein
MKAVLRGAGPGAVILGVQRPDLALAGLGERHADRKRCGRAGSRIGAAALENLARAMAEREALGD